MKLSISKRNTVTRKISKTISGCVTNTLKNKKVQITLVSIPVFGWIGSEIRRKADNRNYQKRMRLYQEALRKHQVEIDILKNDKEREEYKRKLWDALIASDVEGQNEQI